MKSDDNPFRLLQEIRERIRSSNDAFANGDVPTNVKYLWLHVTSNGLEGGGNGKLTTEDWLNIVDEAGALGVQWIVVGWESSPAKETGVWEICRWAQDAHDCHVGIHVLGEKLTEPDISALKALNLTRTHLLAPRTHLEDLKFLESSGVEVCEADVNVAHRTGTCTLPDEMVCVGPEGKLYTCGLVLGDERFCLGSVFDRAFAHVVRDESLPHHVPDTVCREGNHHTCDACPPLMVERTLQGKR